MENFIGRRDWLKKLGDLSHLKRPKILVVKGRRRVGKSRLIQEFAKGKRFLNFAGVAPSDTINTQDQRNNFIYQLSTQVKNPIKYADDWNQALTSLTSCITDEETVILLDEISWMGSGDASFVAKLKNWWDLELQKFPNLTLVFCGSIFTWIEENIISSTAFFGRITLTIELEPLSLNESREFLHLKGFKGSTYDIIKILSVVGGIPWYLEQISPIYMADKNIKQLCFEKGGILVSEFDHIFNDLFQNKSKIYRDILEILKDGMKPLEEVRKILAYNQSGTLSNHMKHLITSGFVTKHAQWSIKTGEVRKQSLYRLSDPYIRFYLKYIQPQKDKIDQNFFKNIELSQIIGIDSIMGFQVENLLLQNRQELLDSIGVSPTDCVFDNPYFQKQNVRQLGLQIDYLVQTKSNNIFICEFKFSRGTIGSEVIDQVKQKIEKFKIPKGFAVSSVLFYMGEISEAIITDNFFYRVVDISQFVETKTNHSQQYHL